MDHRPWVYRASVLALLAIVVLTAAQPLEGFWHLVHDHLTAHSHAGHDDMGGPHGDADIPDHDADHEHSWMMAAAVFQTPHVSQPQMITALELREDPSWRSATPFPPFSPPRA